MRRIVGPTHPAAVSVQEVLNRLGLESQVVEFPSSTRTAREAADTIGTTVAQIAKSLVFVAGDEFILVVASGKNRVNEKKLKELFGVKVKRADAEQVRQATGYAIGGVPPVGHPRPLRTLIDEDLMIYPEIFAAAGTPRAVFRLTPDDLFRITQGEIMDLKE
jgi:prolyl-tRNA editing enzyme YbaK/EbsC (Cys-tRNA(Pro) deacylase)